MRCECDKPKYGAQINTKTKPFFSLSADLWKETVISGCHVFNIQMPYSPKCGKNGFNFQIARRLWAMRIYYAPECQPLAFSFMSHSTRCHHVIFIFMALSASRFDMIFPSARYLFGKHFYHICCALKHSNLLRSFMNNFLALITHNTADWWQCDAYPAVQVDCFFFSTFEWIVWILKYVRDMLYWFQIAFHRLQLWSYLSIKTE